MSKNLLDKFYDYTIQGNSGFKIAIGDLVVSVACHNHLDAYDEMNGNGIAGSNINIEKMPSDLMAFTFDGNNTEVAVFNQKTGEYVTNEFTDLADDYDNIAYGVIPSELIEILVNVKNYKK